MIIVTWLPRATVIVDGQTWPLWMTMVFGSELGVHPPVGLVVLEELPPPHAVIAAAAAIAAAVVIRRTVVRVIDRFSVR